MLAGTYRMSAASESAAVACRLAELRRTPRNAPQRKHSAAELFGRGSTRCTRPQVSHAMTLSAAIRYATCKPHARPEMGVR